MVVFFIFSILALSRGSLSEIESHRLFSSFQSRFSKSYSESEYSHRYSIFKSNLGYVEFMNSKSLGFSLDMGPFADQTFEEFSRSLARPFESHPAAEKFISTENLPFSVDWVEKGMLSPLRTLNVCKATWAYAVVDTIESIIAITLNTTIVPLSIQQIISCSNSYGNNYCTSGTLYNTFNYTVPNCLTSNLLYPLINKTVTTCQKRIKCVAAIDDYVSVPVNNELQLKAYVAMQPVAVTLTVSSTIQMYGGGIIPYAWCGTGNYTSNFVVVGYGSIAGNDFWVIRSYFGSNWGLKGYALLERNDLNVNSPGACGIAQGAFAPVFNPN